MVGRVLAVLLLAVGLTACSSDDSDPFQLKVGDCLPKGDRDGLVNKVETIACNEPHVAEIYDAITVDKAAAYPGDAEMTRQAGACEASFEDFIGKPYSESDLRITYFHPTKDSWAHGDREILCIVENPVGTVTGSLKGTAR